jgi:16S rRNA (adenine1518-N6/adenine1519-N6)-dimethyltransferase
MFLPAPKVDSQVVILTRRLVPLISDDINEQFFLVVKAGFSERRKKLRSSLSGGLRISKIQADDLIKNAGLSPDGRAQELPITQWLSLTYTIKLKNML